MVDMGDDAGSVSVYRAPQMVDAGHADVLVILQVPGKKQMRYPLNAYGRSLAR